MAHDAPAIAAVVGVVKAGCVDGWHELHRSAAAPPRQLVEDAEPFANRHGTLRARRGNRTRRFAYQGSFYSIWTSRGRRQSIAWIVLAGAPGIAALV